MAPVDKQACFCRTVVASVGERPLTNPKLDKVAATPFVGPQATGRWERQSQAQRVRDVMPGSEDGQA